MGSQGSPREIEPMHLSADRPTRRDWLELGVYKPHCWQSAAGNSRPAYLRHGVKASGPKTRWCDSQAGADGPGNEQLWKEPKSPEVTDL